MWLHRKPASLTSNAGAPTSWSVVTDRGELEAWNRHHDSADVLPPPVLVCAHFRVLAKRTGQHIVAGAVARLGSGVVDISTSSPSPASRSTGPNCATPSISCP